MNTCNKLFATVAALALGAHFSPVAAGQKPPATLDAAELSQKLAASRPGDRTSFLRALFEEIALDPRGRDRAVERARARAPQWEGEIGRALETSRLLDNLALAGRGFAGAGTAQRSPLAVSWSQRLPAAPQFARSVDLTTWNYLQPHPTPGSVPDPYGWALNRADLSRQFSSDTLKEFNANWSNRAVGQAAALNAVALPGVPDSRVTGITGRGVTVAVIDSGIDATFADPANPAAGFSALNPEFTGRLSTASRSCTSNGCTALDITDDSGGHGTHVAGIIGAASDNAGTLGIAPGATILALKGVGGNSDSDQAIVYAANQADVRIINGSFGPSPKQNETTWVTGSLSAEWGAVKAALSNGKLLVFATGNDFEKAPVQAANPTGISLFPFIRPENAGALNSAGTKIYDTGDGVYNAAELDALPGVIVAVSAVNADLKIASYANRCGVAAAWCVVAPGGDSSPGGAYPNQTQDDILSTVPASYKGLIAQHYGYQAGTSQATPAVSGVLAVLIEAYPSYTPRQIVRLLFATAEDLGAPGVDAVYGHGLVRIDRALDPGPSFNLADATATYAADVPAGQTQFWAAPINAPGALSVNASRSRAGGQSKDLVIAGVASFAGGVKATNSILEVDGQLSAPTIAIGANATLSGDGVVIGNIKIDGALEPGSGGPATLTIAGKVLLNPGSFYYVTIDGPSTSDGPGAFSKVVVTGAGSSFTAGGTADLLFRGIAEGSTDLYKPAIGAKFAIVEAVNGAKVNGRFAGVIVNADDTGDTGLPKGARADLLYAVDSIVAAVTPLSYAGLPQYGTALSRAQRAVARALDRARPAVDAVASADQTSLFSPLYGLGTQDIPGALGQLSGRDTGAGIAAALAAAQQFSGALGDRMSALRSGGAAARNSLAPVLSLSSTEAGGVSAQTLSYAPAAAASAPGTAATTGVWAHGFGAWSRTSGDASGPGARVNGGGLMAGVDHVFAPGLVGGFSAAVARSRATAGSYSGVIDSYFGAFYGSATSGAWEFDGSLGLGATRQTSRRAIAFGGLSTSANGRANSLGLLAAGELGYRFRFATQAAPGWIKPFVALAYGNLRRDGFAETGAGALGLAFPGQTFNRLTHVAGAKLGFDVETAEGLNLRPELKLGWLYDIARTRQLRAALLGEAFATPILQPGRSGALVGIGLDAWSGAGVTASINYAGEFRAHAQTHQVNFGLRTVW